MSKKPGRPPTRVKDRLVQVFSRVSKDERRTITRLSKNSNQSKWIRKAIRNQIKRDQKK